jgi:hypothetical protein
LRGAVGGSFESPTCSGCGCSSSQTWFERNWFIVSAFLGFLLSIVVPSQWIDMLLKAVKPENFRRDKIRGP